MVGNSEDGRSAGVVPADINRAWLLATVWTLVAGPGNQVGLCLHSEMQFRLFISAVGDSDGVPHNISGRV